MVYCWFIFIEFCRENILMIMVVKCCYVVIMYMYLEKLSKGISEKERIIYWDEDLRENFFDW